MKKILILACFLPAMITGCTTFKPVPNDRTGLLDQLSELRQPGVEYKSLSPQQMAELQRFTNTWQWPLNRVVITSPYGMRGSGYHEGMDLKAGKGASIRSVQTGHVIYSGSTVPGYGKMVVIEHDAGLFSLYAHNSKNVVKKGAHVKKGQLIAFAGRTGRATGPHLHFEVRYGTLALDPMQLMRTDVVVNPNRAIANQK